jgi:predicted outer membrane repeat protein
LKIVKTQNPIGFIQNKKAAKQGGAVAGNARLELESRTGRRVVSPDNYLPEAKKNKRQKKVRRKNSQSRLLTSFSVDISRNYYIK